MRNSFIAIFISINCLSFSSLGQGCCSGGGGTPLAGGASTGVLQKGQMEVMGTYQYSRSNKFLTKDSDTLPFFDNLSSNYLFLKVDYGLSEKLTFSASTGYFLNRTISEFRDTTITNGQVEIEKNEVSSSGFGDIILLPRYSVFNKTKEVNRTELTLGLGWKIPIGSHDDSTFIGYASFLNTSNNPPTIDSTQIWQTSPPTVQTTTGANDLLVYGFFFKSFPHRRLRLFASGLYIHRGWNSLGLKFGDYASVGLFAGTTIAKNLSLNGQIKGEIVGKMQAHRNIDPLSLYSIDTNSTGSRMVSFIPQISYTFKGGITLFALADFPLYQYMNGTQIASQHKITVGLSHGFQLNKQKEPVVPLEPENTHVADGATMGVFKIYGNCDMCKTKIEKTLKDIVGVSTAIWDIERKMVEVTYDASLVTEEKMQKELAKVGYDSEKFRATDKAYNKLHGCCKYERPE